METFRKAQLEAIKRRIIDIFDQKVKEAEAAKSAGKKDVKIPTVYSLYHELNRNNDFGVGYSTFRNTLTESEEGSVDVCTVLALCYHWNIDTSFVFSPWENEKKQMPPICDMISSNEGNFIALEDPSYCGEFFGYMHTQNTNHKKHVAKFKLDIRSENGYSRATLYYYGISGKARVFHGEPILAAKKNFIFIIFKKEDGNFFIFQYSYKKYGSSNLYFRKGFVSTTSSITGNPMVESFVLFSRKLSQKNEKYVDGLLPLADSEFYVSKKVYEKLIETEQGLKTFDQRLSFLFSGDADTVYQISENQIYETLKKQSYLDMNIEEVGKALNVLKDHSITPTRIEYFDSPQLAAFAKNVLQQIPTYGEEANT